MGLNNSKRGFYDLEKSEKKAASEGLTIEKAISFTNLTEQQIYEDLFPFRRRKSKRNSQLKNGSSRLFDNRPFSVAIMEDREKFEPEPTTPQLLEKKTSLLVSDGNHLTWTREYVKSEPVLCETSKTSEENYLDKNEGCVYSLEDFPNQDQHYNVNKSGFFKNEEPQTQFVSDGSTKEEKKFHSVQESSNYYTEYNNRRASCTDISKEAEIYNMFVQTPRNSEFINVSEIPTVNTETEIVRKNSNSSITSSGMSCIKFDNDPNPIFLKKSNGFDPCSIYDSITSSEVLQPSEIQVINDWLARAQAECYIREHRKRQSKISTQSTNEEDFFTATSDSLPSYSGCKPNRVTFDESVSYLESSDSELNEKVTKQFYQHNSNRKDTDSSSLSSSEAGSVKRNMYDLDNDNSEDGYKSSKENSEDSEEERKTKGIPLKLMMNNNVISAESIEQIRNSLQKRNVTHEDSNSPDLHVISETEEDEEDEKYYDAVEYGRVIVSNTDSQPFDTQTKDKSEFLTKRLGHPDWLSDDSESKIHEDLDERIHNSFAEFETLCKTEKLLFEKNLLEDPFIEKAHSREITLKNDYTSFDGKDFSDSDMDEIELRKCKNQIENNNGPDVSEISNRWSQETYDIWIPKVTDTRKRSSEEKVSKDESIYNLWNENEHLSVQNMEPQILQEEERIILNNVSNENVKENFEKLNDNTFEIPNGVIHMESSSLQKDDESDLISNSPLHDNYYNNNHIILDDAKADIKSLLPVDNELRITAKDGKEFEEFIEERFKMNEERNIFDELLLQKNYPTDFDNSVEKRDELSEKTHNEFLRKYRVKIKHDQENFKDLIPYNTKHYVSFFDPLYSNNIFEKCMEQNKTDENKINEQGCQMDSVSSINGHTNLPIPKPVPRRNKLLNSVHGEAKSVPIKPKKRTKFLEKTEVNVTVVPNSNFIVDENRNLMKESIENFSADGFDYVTEFLKQEREFLGTELLLDLNFIRPSLNFQRQTAYDETKCDLKLNSNRTDVSPYSISDEDDGINFLNNEPSLKYSPLFENKDKDNNFTNIESNFVTEKTKNLNINIDECKKEDLNTVLNINSCNENYSTKKEDNEITYDDCKAVDVTCTTKSQVPFLKKENNQDLNRRNIELLMPDIKEKDKEQIKLIINPVFDQITDEITANSEYQMKDNTFYDGNSQPKCLLTPVYEDILERNFIDCSEVQNVDDLFDQIYQQNNERLPNHNATKNQILTNESKTQSEEDFKDHAPKNKTAINDSKNQFEEKIKDDKSINQISTNIKNQCEGGSEDHTSKNQTSTNDIKNKPEEGFADQLSRLEIKNQSEEESKDDTLRNQISRNIKNQSEEIHLIEDGEKIFCEKRSNELELNKQPKISEAFLISEREVFNEVRNCEDDQKLSSTISEQYLSCLDEAKEITSIKKDESLSKIDNVQFMKEEAQLKGNPNGLKNEFEEEDEKVVFRLKQKNNPRDNFHRHLSLNEERDTKKEIHDRMSDSYLQTLISKIVPNRSTIKINDTVYNENLNRFFIPMKPKRTCVGSSNIKIDKDKNEVDGEEHLRKDVNKEKNELAAIGLRLTGEKLNTAESDDEKKLNEISKNLKEIAKSANNLTKFDQNARSEFYVKVLELRKEIDEMKNSKFKREIILLKRETLRLARNLMDE